MIILCRYSCIIRKDPALKAFCDLPNKENGIDTEVLAVRDKWLHVGFRGSVFRKNMICCTFNLADAVFATWLLCQIAFRSWPGRSAMVLIRIKFITGTERTLSLASRLEDIGKLHLLGEMQPPDGCKTEGVAVIEEQAMAYQLVVAYDGAPSKNRVLQRFTLNKQ